MRVLWFLPICKKMADPVIRVKRSTVQGKTPTTGQLGLGEIAINHYDGKIFIRQDTGGVGIATTVISIGVQGAQGVQGAVGAQGSQGVQGATGDQGSQGVQGAVGAQGVQGATGAQGVQGATGAQGVQGAVGAQGAGGLTTTTATAVTASADQAIVNQDNGNSSTWYGRVLSKNSTSDKASFLGSYGSVAGVFAHNNVLNAWADLYVNTVDGSTGGAVRMPSSVLVNGSQVWHSGNDGSGSGLDADTLDGVSSGSFLRSDTNDTMNYALAWDYAEWDFSWGSHGSGSGSQPISIRVWDNYSQSGSPSSFGTILDIYGYSGHEHDQLYFYQGSILHRYGWYGNDNWSSWYTVWTSNNDGAGSGLDADLLDGLNATSANTGSTIVARDSNGDFNARYINATNFADGIGSYNVNLGSSGIEGRGLVAGYSGGSYGGIGFNVRHTTTGGSWIAPLADTSSYLLFTAGGFAFYGAGAGTAGRTLSYTSLATLSSGGNLVLAGGSHTANGNTIWHAGNDGAGSGLDADLLDGLNATSANTGSTIVARDSNGDFSARYISAASITSSGSVSAAGASGFYSTTFASNARNPIWRFANADGYGLSYFQGSAGVSPSGGGDTIGFHFGTATAAGSLLQLNNGSGAVINGTLQVTGAITGTASSSNLLNALSSYVWSSSTLPNSYNLGIQCSFVGPSVGEGSWQSYGSVMNMMTYSGGGGSLQLYVPYSPSYGGNGLQVRFGNYDVSSGNSWTSWKTLWDSGNDGAGSGLDADLLDGLSSGSFLRSDAGTTWTDSCYFRGSATYGFRFNDNADSINALTVNNSGTCTAYADFRAPIFYDSNNTNYYCDPASTSTFFQINLTGRLAIDNPADYASTAITSLSTAPIDSYIQYDPSAGTSVVYYPMIHQTALYNSGYRNHTSYGLLKRSSGYEAAHYFAIGGSDSAPTESFFLNYGGSISHTNGYVFISGSARTPILYDGDNTGYYADPDGTSRLNIVKPNIITSPYDGTNSGITRSSYAYSFGFQESGSWSGSYPDLVIQYHTGLTFAANSSYDGMTFKKDYNDDTVIFRVNGGSNYLYKYNWLYTNTTGFYSDTNSWHMLPNSVSSYGGTLLRGSRNGWYGIHFESGGNIPHVMFDGSANGGFYYESGGRWALYYSYANASWGVNTSSTSSTASLYVSGNIYTTGNLNSASDARLKDNVVAIKGSLDKVLKLRGVNFTWNNLKENDENYGKTQMGFIAQEVEPIIPEVVTYAEDVDQYAVNYGQITALLTEAIKEQNEVINTLKTEIENLKNKLGE